VIRGFVVRDGHFTNFIVPRSTSTTLYRINSQGTAVGVFSDTQGAFHGFTRSSNGTITRFPDAAPAADTLPTGINDHGDVSGAYSLDGFATSHGFIYQDRHFITFDAPGSSYTVVWDITNEGTAVGSFSDAAGDSHGFLLDCRGNFTEIDIPGSTFTAAYGVNDSGDIVGQYGDETSIHGYLLHRGDFTRLDYPGATDTVALDINDPGDIVGTYNGFSRGFLAKPSSH
jgi:uncharacterized membrane protein